MLRYNLRNYFWHTLKTAMTFVGGAPQFITKSSTLLSSSPPLLVLTAALPSKHLRAQKQIVQSKALTSRNNPMSISYISSHAQSIVQILTDHHRAARFHSDFSHLNLEASLLHRIGTSTSIRSTSASNSHPPKAPPTAGWLITSCKKVAPTFLQFSDPINIFSLRPSRT